MNQKNASEIPPENTLTDAEAQNLKFWDEVAPVHFKSYEIEPLRQGRSVIDSIQRQEFYPVAGKSLLHLQCHIGTDTLSLALDGARVTGVDFSTESLKLAEQLRYELGLEARFVHANVYDLPEKLTGEYDIVYSTKGVLCWLKDLDTWARIVAKLLKSGGTFYLMDTHPLLPIFDDRRVDELRVAHTYYHENDAIIWDDDLPDYADSEYIPQNHTCEWQWTLSDIINAITGAGLVLEFLNEHPRLYYAGFPGMIMDADGWFDFPGEYAGMLPQTFSLRARKP